MKRFKTIIALVLAVSMALSDSAFALAKTPESGSTTLAAAEYASPSNADYATPSNADMMLGVAMSPDTGEGVLFEGYSWMSNLNADMKVKNLTLPETHDAGTFNIYFARLDPAFDILTKGIEKKLKDSLGGILGKFVSLFQDALVEGIIKPVLNYLTTAIQKSCGKCQTLTIEEQLNNGVRALDLRFRYDNGEFNIYHGDVTEGLKGLFFTCECCEENDKKTRLTLERAFQKIQKFLETNEDEVIFLKVQNEGGEYNPTVEKELKELEKKYGIYTDYAMRDSKGKDFSELGEKKLGQVRGNVYDITDAINDISGKSWKATVATKKKKILEAIDNKAMGLPGEIQCNIQMKAYYFLDPNDECHIHFTPVYWTILGMKVPHDIIIDFSDLFISPKQNADDINPWVHELLEKVTTNKQRNVAENGLGLVSTDFTDRRMCWRIANVNSVNENWGPEFIFVEGGEDEPEEPGKPEEEQYVFDLTKLDNYDEVYEIIKKNKGNTTGANVSPITYSRYWQTDTQGTWRVKDSKGETVVSAWLCDDAVKANGQNVWYLLGADGQMISNGLVQDRTGNFYSMETSHNGFFGSIRYKDGVYDCNGQSVYLEFNRQHNGSFGAIINPEGIETLKAIYGIKQYDIGNDNAAYTSQF